MELVKGKEGWEYQSDKRKYSLYEGMCLDSERRATSDLCFIMDDKDLDRDEEIVGYVWGASFIKNPCTRKEWGKAIGRIVERYETKQHMPNGIARLEHAKKIVEAYLETNNDVLFAKDADMISKDIEYLTTLIERAKEMQR